MAQNPFVAHWGAGSGQNGAGLVMCFALHFVTSSTSTVAFDTSSRVMIYDVMAFMGRCLAMSSLSYASVQSKHCKKNRVKPSTSTTISLLCRAARVRALDWFRTMSTRLGTKFSWCRGLLMKMASWSYLVTLKAILPVFEIA